jgi:hypothetical protein
VWLTAAIQRRQAEALVCGSRLGKSRPADDELHDVASRQLNKAGDRCERTGLRSALGVREALTGLTAVCEGKYPISLIPLLQRVRVCQDCWVSPCGVTVCLQAFTSPTGSRPKVVRVFLSCGTRVSDGARNAS